MSTASQVYMPAVNPAPNIATATTRSTLLTTAA